MKLTIVSYRSERKRVYWREKGFDLDEECKF